MNKANLIATRQVFSELLQHIQQAKQKVFSQANIVLIDLYWQLGETISEKVKSETWCKGVVMELAKYIAQNDPDSKGFSDKNLWRMKQFYETYHNDEKLATLWRALSWSHNLAIFSRCKTSEEREFYLNLSNRESYSFRELDRQISACLFERTMLGNQKLSAVLRELHPNVNQIFKDNYVIEFLGLPDRAIPTAIAR